LHGERFGVITLEHGDPESQGEERMRTHLEQRDVIVSSERTTFGVGESQPGRGLTGVAVQDLVRLLGLPPGDQAGWILPVLLHQQWIPIDGEQELVEQVLAHASTPFGYQVK
jgi:hypothetical protein